MMAVPVAGTAS